MLRLTLGVAAVGVLAAVVGVSVLLITNPAPAVPALLRDDQDVRPYLVKLHARWCPVCMMTKDVWTALEQNYGSRLRLVVFDFTTEATTENSRAVARQLNLESLFDEYRGETGTVLVVNGSSKAVEHSLHGNLEWADYAAVIDAVLAAVPR
jgi:thiol-disulfide isomerase/thioredoxin